MLRGTVVNMSGDDFVARLDSGLKSRGWTLTAAEALAMVREVHESMLEEEPDSIPNLPDYWLESVYQAYKAESMEVPTRHLPSRP